MPYDFSGYQSFNLNVINLFIFKLGLGFSLVDIYFTTPQDLNFVIFVICVVLDCFCAVWALFHLVKQVKGKEDKLTDMENVLENIQLIYIFLAYLRPAIKFYNFLVLFIE